MECKTGVQGLPLGGGDGGWGSFLWPYEHRGPGVERAPHPGCISHVRNAETPSRSGELTGFGKPTVRGA